MDARSPSHVTDAQDFIHKSRKRILRGREFLSLFTLSTLLLSYWRSFEDLENFARSPSEPHLQAWRSFNEAVGTDGSVGIWHETYLVGAGKYEAVYGNMPKFGLAAATSHIPAIAKKETARRRLGGENEPAVPTPPNNYTN